MPLPILDDPRLPENLRNGLPEWWSAMHSLRTDRTLVEIPRDQWADVLFSRSVGFGLVTQGTDSPHVDEFIFRNGARPDGEHAQGWARHAGSCLASLLRWSDGDENIAPPPDGQRLYLSTTAGDSTFLLSLALIGDVFGHRRHSRQDAEWVGATLASDGGYFDEADIRVCCRVLPDQPCRDTGGELLVAIESVTACVSPN